MRKSFRFTVVTFWKEVSGENVHGLGICAGDVV
jgi:hypothetical protein